MCNRRWLYFVLGLVLSLGVAWPNLASSQALGGGLVPIGSAGGYSYPGGLQGTADFRYSGSGGPGANDPIYRRPYGMPNGSLGGLARGLAKNAMADALLLAALAGVGYFMDSILNDIYKPGTPYVPAGTIWYVSKASFGLGAGYYAANSISAVCPLLPGGVWSWDGAMNRCTPPPGKSPPYWPTLPGMFTGANVPPNAAPNVYPSPTPSAVSNEDLGKLVAANPNTWPGVLNDAQGRPYQTAELASAQNQLANQLNAAYNANIAQQAMPNPGLAPSVNTTPLPGTATNPNGTTTTSTAAEPAALTFPVFCTWASTICSLADWFREAPDADPDLELPDADVPLPAPGFTSSLGGGSCPSPIIVTVMGSSIPFSYQPMCTLAGYLYYVSLAGAALLGAYIISGKKRA